MLQKAKNQPQTQQDFLVNFAKSEYFSPQITEFITDGIFIAKSTLNEFRRTVYECLYQHLTKRYKREISTVKVQTNLKATPLTDFAFIESVNEPLTAKNIIYSPEIYRLKDVLTLKEKCLQSGKKLYLDTPNFALDKDVEFVGELIKESGVSIVANNYYALLYDCEKVIGGGLNVYNSVTANYYDAPVITAEDGLFEKTNFAYMTLRHCPIKNHTGCSCETCKYSNDYTYKMDNGKILQLKRKKLSTCTFYLV